MKAKNESSYYSADLRASYRDGCSLLGSGRSGVVLNVNIRECFFAAKAI
jgi:hypothetical protein